MGQVQTHPFKIVTCWWCRHNKCYYTCKDHSIDDAPEPSLFFRVHYEGFFLYYLLGDPSESYFIETQDDREKK